MDQTFYTIFQFNECTVIREADNFALDFGANRVNALYFQPWIRSDLLQAERNALTLTVVFKNLDFNFLTDGENIGRMVDTAPGHISDMQQAVNATEVNK